MKSFTHFITTLPILIVLLSACTGGKTRTQEDIKLQTPEFTANIELSVADSVLIDDVFSLCNWKVGNNQLIIHNNTTDSILSLFTWPQGQLLCCDVNIGPGPDEFIVINPGNAIDADQMLIYDMMKREVAIFDTSEHSFLKVGQFALLTDDTGLAYPYTYITQLSDSTFLLKTDFPDESFWHIADLKHNSIISRIDNPIRTDRTSYTPFDFIQLTADSTMAVIYRYMPLVQFYDISNLANPSLSASFGKRQNQSDIENYDYLENTYLSATTDGTLLFCLKSTDGGESGNQIDVFNLSNHTPFGTIGLDRNVTDIKCDDQGNLIGYAPHQNSTVFYIWDLNKVNSR